MNGAAAGAWRRRRGARGRGGSGGVGGGGAPVGPREAALAGRRGPRQLFGGHVGEERGGADLMCGAARRGGFQHLQLTPRKLWETEPPPAANGPARRASFHPRLPPPAPPGAPTRNLLASVAGALRVAGHGSAAISNVGCPAGAGTPTRHVPRGALFTPPLLAKLHTRTPFCGGAPCGRSASAREAVAHAGQWRPKQRRQLLPAHAISPLASSPLPPRTAGALASSSESRARTQKRSLAGWYCGGAGPGRTWGRALGGAAGSRGVLSAWERPLPPRACTKMCPRRPRRPTRARQCTR